MGQLYIGIENEICSFDRQGNPSESLNSVNLLFERNGLKNGQSEDKWYRIIKTGNGVYNDRDVVELLTPPIRINKGFAMRLADSLTIPRNLLTSLDLKEKYTGYSMHWNLTSIEENPELNQYWSGLAIPFLLLGVNPISCGVNMRCKDYPGRYEILGESLQSHEQIAATALLLGAYHLAWANGERAPINMIQDLETRKIERSQRERWGRKKVFKVNISSDSSSKVEFLKAQKVLEVTHQWLRPYIAKLGTEEDSKYLKEFVEGSKILEIDEKEKFGRIKRLSQFRSGMYYPRSKHTINNSGQNIRIPIENKLLLLLSKLPNSEFIEWDYIDLEQKQLNGTDEIYTEALRLAKKQGLKYALRENPKIEIDAERRSENKIQLERLLERLKA